MASLKAQPPGNIPIHDPDPLCEKGLDLDKRDGPWTGGLNTVTGVSALSGDHAITVQHRVGSKMHSGGPWGALQQAGMTRRGAHPGCQGDQKLIEKDVRSSRLAEMSPESCLGEETPRTGGRRDLPVEDDLIVLDPQLGL